MKHPVRAVILAASLTLGLSGCVTDDYGYGGVSMGYGSGYGDYYGSPYYGDAYYGGGGPYSGWYDGFYYPGTGYYIYDRGGVRRRWTDGQRRYWEGRRGNNPDRENWGGFRRDGNRADGSRPDGSSGWRGRQDQQGLSVEARQQQRDAWRAQRQQSGQGRVMTDEARQARREAWQAQRQQQAQQQPAQPQGQAPAARPSWQGRGEGWQGQRQGGPAMGNPGGRGNNAGRGGWGRSRGN